MQMGQVMLFILRLLFGGWNTIIDWSYGGYCSLTPSLRISGTLDTIAAYSTPFRLPPFPIINNKATSFPNPCLSWSRRRTCIQFYETHAPSNQSCGGEKDIVMRNSTFLGGEYPASCAFACCVIITPTETSVRGFCHLEESCIPRTQSTFGAGENLIESEAACFTSSFTRVKGMMFGWSVDYINFPYPVLCQPFDAECYSLLSMFSSFLPSASSLKFGQNGGLGPTFLQPIGRSAASGPWHTRAGPLRIGNGSDSQMSPNSSSSSPMAGNMLGFSPDRP